MNNPTNPLGSCPELVNCPGYGMVPCNRDLEVLKSIGGAKVHCPDHGPLPQHPMQLELDKCQAEQRTAAANRKDLVLDPLENEATLLDRVRKLEKQMAALLAEKETPVPAPQRRKGA